MTDRSTAVRLRAEVAGYVAGMRQAATATRTFVDDARRGTGKVSEELVGVSGKATLVGAALLALPAAAIAVNTAFDKQMSGVQAVTNATAAEMDRLRSAAIAAGQATAFSASDAAAAEAELAKAGISTSDILSGALAGSLALAAAGQIQVADAATISAQAMNTFGLAGNQVGHVADVLAAGANKSAADVSQLGMALAQGGLVADQTGLSFEDTVGVLSAFADKALIGSDAGTSLKTMLQRLTPQSKEAADAMEGLGIHAYDAQGNFVGLDKFAQNLQQSLKDLDPESRNTAMSIIFGSDAVRAASILYDLGGKGVREYTGAVNDQGAAARMAGVQLDNLAGDYEQLKGSIETALIQSGSNANGVLRDMTQAATGAVNFIGQLPAPILATGLAITTFGGAFLIAAPRIVAVNTALAASPGLARAASAAFLGLGPVVAVAAIAGITTEMMDANRRTQELEDSTRSLFRQLDTRVSTDGIDELRTKIKEAQDQIDHPGFFGSIGQGIEQWRVWTQGADDAIRSWGNFQAATAEDRAPTTLQRQQSTVAELRAEYAKYLEVTGRVAVALGTTGTRAQELFNASGVSLAGTVGEITYNVVDYAKSTSQGSLASQTAAAAMNVLSDSTTSTADKLKAMKTAWDATVGVMLASSDAEIAAEAAIDSLTESLKKNGRSWDINTEKGRSNRSAYNDVIAAAGRAAEAKLDEGASVEDANATYDHYLRKLLRSKGLTDEQRLTVKRLISEGYSKLPATKTTTVKADTSQAEAAVAALKSSIASINGVRVEITASGDINAHGTSTRPRRATGGPIVGPGSGTSDDVPIWASNGEYVMTAAAVDRYGADTFAAMNAGSYAKGGRVRKKRSQRAADARARRQEIAQSRASMIDAAGIGTAWDPSAYDAAVSRAVAARTSQSDAEAALFDARRAVNSAATPQEQAAALAQLTKAEKDLAAAKRETAAADKEKAKTALTGANILAKWQTKAAKLKRFRADLKTLEKRGLSPVILNELWGEGIETGGDMAAALVRDGDITALNATQASIANDAGAIARRAYGWTSHDPASAGGGGGSTSGSSMSSSAFTVSLADPTKPVVLKMDSRDVWKGLLELKKSRGGVELGLK